MKFTEAQLESAIIELLGAEGYPYVLGETLEERSSSCVSSEKDGAGAPSLPGVLIKEDLRAFLTKRYAGAGIMAVEIEAVGGQAAPVSPEYFHKKTLQFVKNNIIY